MSVPANQAHFTSTIPTSGGIVLLLKKTWETWKMGAYCTRLDSKSGGNLAASLKLLKGDIGILNSGKLDEEISSIVVVNADNKDTVKQTLSKGGALHTFLDQVSKLQQWTLINDTECDATAQSNYDCNIWLGFNMRAANNSLYTATQPKAGPTLHVYKDNLSKQDAKYFSSVLEGMTLTKSLVSTPPNVLTTESYVEYVKQEFADLDVDITVLDRDNLASHKMNCMLGVAQGSIHEPYAVILHLKKGVGAPLALVGKGVTFDTGGLGLKPSGAMTGMKKDMAGSAAVVGAIKALATNNSEVNVIGIIGLVENAIGPNSYRPDDILVSAAGKSVEIGHTDAEGRLVLCDLLHYVQTVLGCKEVVDIATLTRAIITSLGHVYAGFFANDDKFAYDLLMAGKTSGERLWRLPLDPEYAALLKSDTADLNNISAPKDGAGSITAAEFLHKFILPGTYWSHIDIAGTACNKSNKTASPDGTTGFGVRLLVDFVHSRTKPIE